MDSAPLEEQLAAFGLTIEDDDHHHEQQDQSFGVYEENRATVEAFVGLQTQWRFTAGAGGVVYQGFDYPAVEAYLRATRARRPRRIFEGLLVMERAARTALNGASGEEAVVTGG